jgi:NADPH:quinone reductase
MKAAVYYANGGPDVFRYEEVPDPVAQPGQVLIEVGAISIEGGDLLNRARGPLVYTPHIVGYQCAGSVREVAEGVSDFRAGDRVVAFMPHGSHAELAAANAATTWKVPDRVELQAAATVPVAFGTADQCVFDFGRLREGETVLVQGAAGGVGLAALQLAKRAGATVLGTASSQARLDRLKEFGLDHGINYKDQDLVEVVKDLTGGRGVDLVVDPVGSTLKDSIRCLAFRGRCVIAGNAGRGETTIDAWRLMMRAQTLSGVLTGVEMHQPNVYAMIQRHIQDVGAGALRMPVDWTFPLSEAEAAHAFIESRQAFGRVLLIPEGGAP